MNELAKREEAGTLTEPNEAENGTCSIEKKQSKGQGILEEYQDSLLQRKIQVLESIL